MVQSAKKRSLDTATFKRVQLWYLLALATIALTIVISQILIQSHLNSQLNDSRVINVAGMQRAYSQKLVKEALMIQAYQRKNIPADDVVQNLDQTLRHWKASHLGLQQGDDSLGLPIERQEDMVRLFSELQPYYDTMVAAAQEIVDMQGTGGNSEIALETPIATLIANEPVFLAKMDALVGALDARSKEQLRQLKYKEFVLFGVSLLVLFLELLFIFRPLSLQIKSTVGGLLASQRKAEEATEQVKKLFQEKERSMEALQELNYVIDQAVLFASAKRDGSVGFISKKFLDLLGYEMEAVNKPMVEVLTTDSGQQQYLTELLKSRQRGIRSEELQIVTHNGERLWMEASIIPMHNSKSGHTLLMLCSDITERKKAQNQMERLAKEHYEEGIRRKQLQASQIVEAQEEERKRIAKDIHDGIGQMLTALKFNIESIDISRKEKAEERITYLKGLSSDLIKGVRTATFNLTPPELTDHGIFPALQKMVAELAKLTGKHILFENRGQRDVRFDSLAETNIYRVAQEAVNNAIKYAEANYILVTINCNSHMLSVVIVDDGKGFDVPSLDTKMAANGEGGMGLYFMKERINYINGRLFIHSVPGEGTRVTINYAFDS